MVERIKQLENTPRVTLWIHPFINMVCGKSWTEAAFKGFLIKDLKNVPQKEGFPDKLPGNTYWWQGVMAGYIDFTNPAAVDWWKVGIQLDPSNIPIIFQSCNEKSN